MTLPRLLVLTDRSQLPAGRRLAATVADCVGSGATHIVLRELDLTHEWRNALAAELLEIPGIVLIAARVPLRGSAGLHLAAAQEVSDGGDAAFHGCSVHDERELGRALAGKASYVLLSPVAPSASKPGYGPSLGPAGVRRLSARAGTTPVFALGGVTTDNAAEFREAGAYGVAVMGAAMRAGDPSRLVNTLITTLEEN